MKKRCLKQASILHLPRHAVLHCNVMRIDLVAQSDRGISFQRRLSRLYCESMEITQLDGLGALI